MYYLILSSPSGTYLVDHVLDICIQFTDTTELELIPDLTFLSFRTKGEAKHYVESNFYREEGKIVIANVLDVTAAFITNDLHDASYYSHLKLPKP